MQTKFACVRDKCRQNSPFFKLGNTKTYHSQFSDSGNRISVANSNPTLEKPYKDNGRTALKRHWLEIT